MHRGILFFVLLSLLSAGALAQSALTVGIDQATRANWDAIATRFQTTTGVKVLLQPYSRNDLAQQIVLQGAARTGRMNLVMVSQAWAQNVLTYLADLSSYESTLVSQGVQTVKLGGRSVGVSLSFAPGWFLAVLAWPADPQVAVSFLA
ncbi:MAG: hypothetical protein NT125_06295, partial [Candidatus Bipolaricaulota bacterium]|nr:hypothetical protein [Candidatus Bipolaricaulota bacterium]